MRIDRRVRFALVALFLLAAALVFIATRQSAAPANGAPFRVLAGQSGPVLDYVDAEFNLSAAHTAPTTGWWTGKIPNLKLLQAAREKHLDPPTVWVRFRFDRARFGTRPLALYNEIARDDFTVYLNGAELYRSRADAADRSFGWNHPLFVPLPAAMLRGGENRIAFRIDMTSMQVLGIGSVRIGADQDVRSTFNSQFFLSNIAPQMVSGYLVILTIGAASFWIKRPKDRIYPWLVLVGLIWLFRNLHYFAQEPPFDPGLFWTMSTDSLFVLMAAVFGFAVAYFDLPHARRYQAALFGYAVVEIIFRHVLVALDLSEFPSFMLALPLFVTMLVTLFRACRRNPIFPYWSMFAAITLAVAFSFHDMFFAFNISNGAGFSLQPYGGLLIFAAFDVALTARLQKALVDVEDVNMQLEARVAEVTGSLARSEAARAELQIVQAVGRERDRIMRDIHDGIGSSLLTALAGARLRGESPDTIATLTRSLTDLRIGVDSLEPIDGDVIALLANLRHRMERELKGAGFAFAWKVDACPPLPWLDPVSALHVLRIVQEAIGNAIAHSEAGQVEVRCRPCDRDGHDGVLIGICDTGTGFDFSAPTRGKGLANMAARAEALAGHFRCESALGMGTIISIWLPVDKA